MRVRSLLAASVALAMGASVANAGFVVTSTRTPSTNVPGFDVIKYFAINDGLDGTGTQLQSVDITLAIQPPPAPGNGNPLKFRLIEAGEDGVDDVDLFGTVPGFSSLNPQGTYVRVGAGTSWNVATAPTGLNSDPDGNGVADSNPGQTFANVKSVRVAGFTSAPVTATGAGAQFAAILAPTGTFVVASGGVAGFTGGITNGTWPDPVPEPATIGLLGLGMMSMMGRRRRA